MALFARKAIILFAVCNRSQILRKPKDCYIGARVLNCYYIQDVITFAAIFLCTVCCRLCYFQPFNFPFDIKALEKKRVYAVTGMLHNKSKNRKKLLPICSAW